MSELEIKFNMVKSNNEDFTDDEIDEFNEKFIELVERHGYLVGGSIGPYMDDDECVDDDEDIDEDFYNVMEDFEPTVSDDFIIGPDGAFEYDEDNVRSKKKRKKH